MKRIMVTLVSLVVMAPLPSIAQSTGGIIELGEPDASPPLLTASSPCASCAARTPVLDSGRPPLPGEGGDGVESCTLIQTVESWVAYCADNVVPDCPALDDVFFAEHTVVVVAVDTVTPRPCDGTSDPLWRLDCIATGSRTVSARVVRERPAGLCLCSAMPQQLQRLFLASAVPKTAALGCRVCEERHSVGCLR